MKKLKYSIDNNGIVRCTTTNKIIAVIGNPTPRQKLRYWFKNLTITTPEWLQELGAAAAYAIRR